LEAAGATTLHDLLRHGATRRGRDVLSAATGIDAPVILRWVNNADLRRVHGVGTLYANLLEAAGVDTVVELATRRPDNLTARMAETNEGAALVERLPTESQVEGWVDQAKTLPRVVHY
jgi:predicted flap endonuclease-1-like 5' DNA nuclease